MKGAKVPGHGQGPQRVLHWFLPGPLSQGRQVFPTGTGPPSTASQEPPPCSASLICNIRPNLPYEAHLSVEVTGLAKPLQLAWQK